MAMDMQDPFDMEEIFPGEEKPEWQIRQEAAVRELREKREQENPATTHWHALMREFDSPASQRRIARETAAAKASYDIKYDEAHARYTLGQISLQERFHAQQQVMDEYVRCIAVIERHEERYAAAAAARVEIDRGWDVLCAEEAALAARRAVKH